MQEKLQLQSDMKAKDGEMQQQAGRVDLHGASPAFSS